MSFPIATRALERLSLPISAEYENRALELESSIRSKRYSPTNAHELARMRVAPSTTLFLEQRNPNSQRVSLRQWELANQWVLEKIQTHAPVDVTAIINLHEILFPEREGIFRGSPVMGGNTDYPEPGGLDELWKRFSRLLETEERSAIVFASKVYQWLITLHFFADANGRLARLAADWILLKEGLVPMSFPDDVASFVSALGQENSLDPAGAVRLVCDAVKRSTLILSR